MARYNQVACEHGKSMASCKVCLTLVSNYQNGNAKGKDARIGKKLAMRYFKGLEFDIESGQWVKINVSD